MKKNYKISLTIFTILLIFLVSLSFSYAKYNKYIKETSDNTIILSDEYLSVNYFNGNYFDIKSLASNDTAIKKISITNVSDIDTFFTIAIMDINKQNDNLNIKLLDSNNQELFNSTLGNMDTEILKTETIKSKETKTYTIYLTNLGTDDNYGLTANIMVYKELAKKNVKNFSEIILANNEIKSIENTNDGLFESNDDDGKTYYFRGSVTNNYVNFSNHTWRIVRINGDGTVRLVLDEVLPDQASYLEKIDMENKFSNILFSKSNAKQVLDNWLSTNFNENINYITKSSFCSDTALSYSEANTDYISSYSRVLTDNNPSLKCLGTFEKLDIGLLSIDEIVYAGATTNDNTGFYLYNSTIYDKWWTLSGSMILNNSNVIDLFAVNNLGKITYQNNLTSPLYLRPVISIDKNISVTGSGAKEDPYIIS